MKVIIFVILMCAPFLAKAATNSNSHAAVVTNFEFKTFCLGMDHARAMDLAKSYKLEYDANSVNLISLRVTSNTTQNFSCIAQAKNGDNSLSPKCGGMFLSFKKGKCFAMQIVDGDRSGKSGALLWSKCVLKGLIKKYGKPSQMVNIDKFDPSDIDLGKSIELATWDYPNKDVISLSMERKVTGDEYIVRLSAVDCELSEMDSDEESEDDQPNF